MEAGREREGVIEREKTGREIGKEGCEGEIVE